LAALAAATGHTVDEIKAKLQELANLGEIKLPIIVSWKDADGNELTGDALYKSVVQKFGEFNHNTLSYEINWGKELANAVIKDFEGNIIGYDPSKVLS